MPKPRTLLLDATFRITDRGLVLATQQWSGVIRVGQRVLLPDGRGGVRAERITAIETGRKTDDKGQPVSWIGILLGELPENEIAEVQAQLRTGEVLTVDDSERTA